MEVSLQRNNSRKNKYKKISISIDTHIYVWYYKLNILNKRFDSHIFVSHYLFKHNDLQKYVFFLF